MTCHFPPHARQLWSNMCQAALLTCTMTPRRCASSLIYGILKSSRQRGKIQNPAVLMNVLIRRGAQIGRPVCGERRSAGLAVEQPYLAVFRFRGCVD